MILFISIRDIFWRWIHIFSFLFFVVWPHRAARSEVARAWRATWFIQKYEYDPTISWCGVSVWAEYAIRESHRHPFRLRSSSKLNMGDGVIFACAVSHYRDEIPTDCLYSFFFHFIFLLQCALASLPFHFITFDAWAQYMPSFSARNYFLDPFILHRLCDCWLYGTGYTCGNAFMVQLFRVHSFRGACYIAHQATQPSSTYFNAHTRNIFAFFRLPLSFHTHTHTLTQSVTHAPGHDWCVRYVNSNTSVLLLLRGNLASAKSASAYTSLNFMRLSQQFTHTENMKNINKFPKTRSAAKWCERKEQ